MLWLTGWNSHYITPHVCHGLYTFKACCIYLHYRGLNSMIIFGAVSYVVHSNGNEN